jgi:hypothetical protein
MANSKAGRPRRDLTESVIRNAMKHTQSNFQAARYLNVSIETYRTYAKMYIDQESGKNLYEFHKNNSGKGIKRINWRNEISIHKINEIMASESYRAIDQEKLKNRLIYEGILRMECYKCGHHEKRVVDYKQPLILNFIDGNKNHWQIDNLRMLCYNCYFLYVGSLFSEKQIKALEDANALQIKEEADWDVDDTFLSFFKDAGLNQTDNYQEGDEYIAKL